MNPSRRVFSIVMLSSLAAPACAAQIFRGTLDGTGSVAAPLAPLAPLGVVFAPLTALNAQAAYSPLAAPALIPPAAALAAPQASAPKISAAADAAGMAGAVQTELKELSKPDLSGEDARASADRLMENIIGRGAAPSKRAKSGVQPLLTGVAFADGVTASQRELFQESLGRRKAAWTRGLTSQGLKLNAPEAPSLTLTVSAAQNHGANAVRYVVDWTQGEIHVGRFHAWIPVKSPTPNLTKSPAPLPPAEKQITLRFKESAKTNIQAFVESQGLRFLSKTWEGIVTAAVTGTDDADEVSRRLTGLGPVLYAAPASFTAPEANRFQLVFKTSAGQDRIGAVLREHGLRVVSVHRGVYTVGAAGLDPMAMTGVLEKESGVLYASPALVDPPLERQFIITLRKSAKAWGPAASEDEIADLLRRHHLLVLTDFGGGTYKVASRLGEAAAQSAGRVAAEPAVESAVAVGALSEDELTSAARSAVSHKGGIWSETEYTAQRSTIYRRLAMRGATPEQLERFDKLCDAAPVNGGRFNPWSGD